MRDDFSFETVVLTTGGLLPLMQDVSLNGFELSAGSCSVHDEVQNLNYRLNNMKFISPIFK